MLTWTQILLGFAAPAAIAAVAPLLAARRATPGAPDRTASGGVSIALGYAVGQVGLRGAGAFPPVEASQWLPYLALLAGLVCGLGPVASGRAAWLHRSAGLGLIAFAPLVLLRARATYSWSGGETAVWVGALVLAIVGLWVELGRILPALPRRAGWAALVVVTAAGAAAITIGGSLVLGLLGAALAAACGGAALAAIVAGVDFEPRSAIVPTVILAGLLVTACFYSELPATSALLLGLAPLAPRLVPRPLVDRSGTWGGPLLCGGAAALPAAAAVALALAASPPLEPYY